MLAGRIDICGYNKYHCNKLKKANYHMILDHKYFCILFSMLCSLIINRIDVWIIICLIALSAVFYAARVSVW